MPYRHRHYRDHAASVVPSRRGLAVTNTALSTLGTSWRAGAGIADQCPASRHGPRRPGVRPLSTYLVLAAALASPAAYAQRVVDTEVAESTSVSSNGPGGLIQLLPLEANWAVLPVDSGVLAFGWEWFFNQVPRTTTILQYDSNDLTFRGFADGQLGYAVLEMVAAGDMTTNEQTAMAVPGLIDGKCRLRGSPIRKRR